MKSVIKSSFNKQNYLAYWENDASLGPKVSIENISNDNENMGRLYGESFMSITSANAPVNG